MNKRVIKRALLIVSICMIAAISIMVLLIASVKHHRKTTQVATSDNGTAIEGSGEYYNAYILACDKENMTLLTGKGEYSLKLSRPVEEDISGQIADVVIKEGLVTSITIKTSRITGSVSEVTEDSIEIKEYGSVKVSENFVIYIFEDSKKVESDKNILKDYGSVEFIMCDDEIQAAIPGKSLADNVRVLITTTGFSSNYHDKVIISAEETFTATTSKGEKYGSGEYKKGSELVFTGEDLAIGETVTVECKGGRIGILSISRNGKKPYYRGSMTIKRTESGYLIVNELPVESYLYGVIPSEMPASYPEEALKAQAVCARSYVYRQMEGSSYAEFGADVDDSTNCQVYNNQTESESIINAVNSTKGQVLRGNGEILKTYYYSTSCGSSAGIHEVWSGEENVFYNSGTILRGESVSEDTKEVFAVVMPDGFNPDLLEKSPLSEEKTFKTFIDANSVTYKFENITVTEVINSYDKDFPWYRWSVSSTLSDYEKLINSRLSDVIKNYAGKVLVKEGEDYVEKSISTIGKLKSISVSKRGESGIVLELTVTGSENTIKVLMQSAVRALLAPGELAVKLSDGSKKSNMELLPSGFFYVSVSDGNISLKGGGYGHGVGLSQNGAKAMAEAGLDYTDILKNYYPDSEIG